jgi:hypothetical protein
MEASSQRVKGEAMEKRCVRHGLALAGVAVAGAAAVAALCYGLWILALSVLWETAKL